jgi:hypothetical protein
MRLDAEVDVLLRSGVNTPAGIPSGVPMIFRACEVHEPDD